MRSQLYDQEYAISQYLMVQRSDVAFIFDHHGILLNVVASLDCSVHRLLFYVKIIPCLRQRCPYQNELSCSLSWIPTLGHTSLWHLHLVRGSWLEPTAGVNLFHTRYPLVVS